MKKLMMAVAIVCAAAFAQAGAVNWSVANITPTSAGITPSVTKYSAFLFIGSDVSDTTDLLDGTSSGFSAFVDKAAASRSATATSKGLISFGATTYGTYANESVSAYVILLDVAAANAGNAKNYMVAKVGGNGDDVITQTFTATGNKNYTWGNQQASSPANKWVAIGTPEPTSGLLLLIGMAALALKRRRA